MKVILNVGDMKRMTITIQWWKILALGLTIAALAKSLDVIPFAGVGCLGIWCPGLFSWAHGWRAGRGWQPTGDGGTMVLGWGLIAFGLLMAYAIQE